MKNGEKCIEKCIENCHRNLKIVNISRSDFGVFPWKIKGLELGQRRTASKRLVERLRSRSVNRTQEISKNPVSMRLTGFFHAQINLFYFVTICINLTQNFELTQGLNAFFGPFELTYGLMKERI